MLDLTLFRRPAMVGASIVAFTLSSSIFALFLYLTLFLQDDLGYGPFAAGIRFLPITLLAFIVAPLAGKLSVRVSSRYLLGTGLLLVTVGLLLMSMIHTSSGWTVLIPGFIVTGFGIGMVNPVLASAAVSVVPPERSGMASGSNNTFRQVGIATGIAGLGAVFQSQIQHATSSALAASATGQELLSRGGAALKGALAGGGVREAAAAIPSTAARTTLLHAYRVGFASTLDHLMIIGAVVSAIGSIGAFILIRQRDFVPSYSPDAVAAEHPAVA
jgi:MFS family permease